MTVRPRLHMLRASEISITGHAASKTVYYRAIHHCKFKPARPLYNTIGITVTRQQTAEWNAASGSHTHTHTPIEFTHQAKQVTGAMCCMCSQWEPTISLSLSLRVWLTHQWTRIEKNKEERNRIYRLFVCKERNFVDTMEESTRQRWRT
jgi:hypothetical protein